MPSRHLVLIGLKYATITLAVVIVSITLLAVYRQGGSTPLAGRLVAPKSTEMPTQYFDAAKVDRGFQVPPNTHVIFTLPDDIPPIRVIDFVGGPRVDAGIRFWGYCFSGSEDQHRTEGRTGRQLYDGQFFYSTAESLVGVQTTAPTDGDLLAIRKSTLPRVREAKKSEIEVLDGGRTCYLMSDDGSSSQLAVVAGVDRDNDRLNSGLEAQAGTSDTNPDTDRDGLLDGTEVFGEQRTNPLEPDTDHDGLWDGVEDANQNGEQDTGETSSVRADTDGDGLCDGPVIQRSAGGGDQKNAGCPEWADVTTVCSKDQSGERVCRPMPASWLYNQGEDINGNGTVDGGNAQAGVVAETDPRTPDTYNGIADMQYKIQQFTQKQGFNPQNARGTQAPAFPIPTMPTGTAQ